MTCLIPPSAGGRCRRHLSALFNEAIAPPLSLQLANVLNERRNKRISRVDEQLKARGARSRRRWRPPESTARRPLSNGAHNPTTLPPTPPPHFAAPTQLLYGPLLALVTASKSAYAAMIKQHSPDGTGALERIWGTRSLLGHACFSTISLLVRRSLFFAQFKASLRRCARTPTAQPRRPTARGCRCVCAELSFRGGRKRGPRGLRGRFGGAQIAATCRTCARPLGTRAPPRRRGGEGSAAERVTELWAGFFPWALIHFLGSPSGPWARPSPPRSRSRPRPPSSWSPAGWAFVCPALPAIPQKKNEL